MIELADSSNSFIDKILNDNLSLIKDCIYKIVNEKFEVEIINNSKNSKEEEEEEHPLLEIIKEKFDGDSIR